MRRSRSNVRRALLSLSLCLAAIAFCEVLARWACSRPLVAERIERLGPRGRLIAQLERYRRSSREETAWYRHKPQMLHPLWGWTNRPGVHLWQGKEVSVNAQGLRSRREYPLSKPPGLKRIEVFGDSFAFGDEAEDDEVFPARLQKSLSRSEVLNFGVSSYGLDQALLRFRDDGARFHPDIVVVGLNSILLDRCNSRFTTWYKPYFEREGARLALAGRPLPAPAEVFAHYQRSSRLLDLVRVCWGSHKAFELGEDSRDELILDEFVAEIRRAKARPLLVLYPLTHEYASGSTAQRFFDAACARTKSDCLDLMPDFARASAQGEHLTQRVHWSPPGHRLVADAVALYLKSRGLAR